MRRTIVMLLGVFLLLGLFAELHLASAQTATADSKPFDNRRLLVQPKNADGSIQLPPIWQDPVLWMRGEQQNFYGAMSGDLRKMRDENSWSASLALMLVSLGYGVFHAAGPGHGKAVISAWLLANRTQLRRGILIAFMSALVQALTAITATTLILWFVSEVAAATKNIAAVLESASYAMIAAMGLYMLWPLLKPYLQRRKITAAPVSGHHFEIINPLPVVAGHIHGPDCDHVHLPSAREVTQDWSWRKAFSMAFAVGIRPCTGALLVLVFANAMGLYAAGIAATFVMSLGTFITVAIIASLAVYARHFAERFAGGEAKWLGWLNVALRLGGGIAIALFGFLLFWGSLSGPSGNM